MPSVTYIEHGGTVHRVEAVLGQSLMQTALAHAVPGIIGECGGAASCGTCHGYVEAAWADKLPPVGESEAMMLEAVLDPGAGSRLCCQIRMRPELDGIVIRLPAEQL